MVALTDEELTSESVLIQLPGGFGCSFRRESYIQEFVHSISEGAQGALTKGELTPESVLMPNKKKFVFN